MLLSNIGIAAAGIPSSCSESSIQMGVFLIVLNEPISISGKPVQENVI